ncbi:hypothetical protein FOC1_g10001512 [Fusarium oxysporum f. sp. cubense race 1]|uniref:DUF6987 domain-containing protein n=1 Tax=Fusarium oxysporum f. sp. cubense (strain race 1) TaxID=1229664 RepID=N4UZK7_FUSC1|nr:hypothetical protein FOC1_g10001512 [Fusarium oxysporum f. sp. cubense race 1]
MSKTKDSTAIPEGQIEDMKEGTAFREQQNPDDAGNIIGTALPLGQDEPDKEKQEEQQEEHREYTTQEAEKKYGRLGLNNPKDTVDRLAGAVSRGKPAVGGVTGALGLGGMSDETPEAPKQAEDVIGQMLEAKTKDQKDNSISFEDCDMPIGDKEVVEMEGRLKEVTSEEVKDKISKVEERVDEKDVPRVPEDAIQDEAPKSEIPEGKARRPEAPDVEVTEGKFPGKEAARELAGVTVEAVGQAPIESRQVGTEGGLMQLKGSQVDEGGAILDRRGNVINKTKAWDAPYPGAEQTAEERLQREQAEQVKAKRKEETKKDKELASALAYNIDQTQDKIRPICKMINNEISIAEAQLGKEYSEEHLVRQVQPLIEAAAKILSDVNGVIQGLNPDSRLQRNAQQKTAIAEATPEDVTTTIDRARRKLESMPHAKKELNPLWALLAVPLFQIIAAIELLLDGMLGLVGRLLHGDVISSLTGRKKE